MDPEGLKGLLEELDPGIVPVGVFVNEDTNTILRIVRESGLKMIQLHGQEGEEMVRTIRRDSRRAGDQSCFP